VFFGLTQPFLSLLFSHVGSFGAGPLGAPELLIEQYQSARTSACQLARLAAPGVSGVPVNTIKSEPSSALDQINDHDDDDNHEQEVD
jgi:hypothetical protein